MRGLLLRLSGFVLACVLGLLLLLFAVEIASTDSSYLMLSAANMALKEDSFSLRLSTTSSLRLYKGYGYEVEEDALYITVYSGDFYTSSRCREWPVTLCIQDPALEGVGRVYFRDGASVKKIYPEQ